MRIRTATRTAAALTAATAGITALTVPPAQAATTRTTARAVARTVDIDGDRRADRVTLTPFNRRADHDTYMLTVRTARGVTAQVPVLVGHVGVGPRSTPAQVFRGTAPADGVRGNEILLELADDVGEMSQHKAYTWRAGRLAVLPMPRATRQGIWGASFSPLRYVQHRFHRTGTNAYLTLTELRRSTSGRYYGSATTYVWTRSGWATRTTRSLSGVMARDAIAMPDPAGVTWR